MELLIQELLKEQKLRIERSHAQKWGQRDVTKTFNLNYRITGITGLRGVGKTTYLLGQKIKNKKSIYISGDYYLLKGINCISLFRTLQKNFDIQTIYIDEIHFLDDWQLILKNIYDGTDLKIIFSGSSSIDIIRGGVDLSRRVMLYHMPTFTFREYLLYSKNIQLPIYTFEDICTHSFDISMEHSTVYDKMMLYTYLQRGQFGYHFEDQEDYSQSLVRSIKKFVYEDLIHFADLKSTNIKKIEDLIWYIGKTGTTEVSINSIAKKLSLSTASVANYMKLLSDGGILDILTYQGNLSDRLRKEKKYYFSNTNMLYLFEPDIGLVRETFVNMVLQNSKIQENDARQREKVFFHKNTDFIFESKEKTYFLEVGGKNKKRDDVLTIKDDITIGSKDEIPMWLLGLI